MGRQHARFEIKHFLNGLIDAYLYRVNLLDTRLPVAELRRRSHINDVARSAGNVEDFSSRIRRGLPGTQVPESIPPITPPPGQESITPITP